MRERVVELEVAPKVQYLPHQAVVREETTTTKVRIAYDASKSTKTGTQGSYRFCNTKFKDFSRINIQFSTTYDQQQTSTIRSALGNIG